MKTRKRQSKTDYRDICEVKDIIKVATTIRTFDKQTWTNLWDGQFICINQDGTSAIESLSRLYPLIQTVAKREIIMARRPTKEQALRYLCTPYVIARRK